MPADEPDKEVTAADQVMLTFRQNDQKTLSICSKSFLTTGQRPKFHNLEEQADINAFSRLNQYFHEVQDEVKNLKVSSPSLNFELTIFRKIHTNI